MIKTSIILILTFIVVPIATYYLDDPLTPEQSGRLWNCIYICLGVASYCFIVSQLTGDTEFASPETLVAFALGLTLFVVTLALNIVALIIVRKYREQYE